MSEPSYNVNRIKAGVKFHTGIDWWVNSRAISRGYHIDFANTTRFDTKCHTIQIQSFSTASNQSVKEEEKEVGLESELNRCLLSNCCFTPHPSPFSSFALKKITWALSSPPFLVFISFFKSIMGRRPVQIWGSGIYWTTLQVQQCNQFILVTDPSNKSGFCVVLLFHFR